MPPKKKTKQSKGVDDTSSAAPFGSVLPKKSTAEKDESELELEEAVFGKRTGFSTWDLTEANKSRSLNDVEKNDESEEYETGLERLQDENIFFVDAPEASTSRAGSPSSVSSTVSLPSPDHLIAPTSQALVRPSKRSIHLLKAAWHDSADAEFTVSLTDTKRLRKLRLNAGEDSISGLEYETRLRRQFEKLHPAPAWVTEARRKILKKRNRTRSTPRHLGDSSQSEESDTASEDGRAVPSEDEADEVADLFRTTGGGKKAAKKRGILPKGEVEIDRVRDANQVESSSGEIVAIEFHPRAQVLFSATSDRRLRLFQIDGTDNPLLQTLHIPELPITTAAYHPSGSSILLTGNRPFFVSYDIQSGTVFRSPRGLLTGGLGGSDRASTGGRGGMERFKFSPEGDILAVGGRRGYVHLVDWGKSGVGNGGQVTGEVKLNVPVKSLAWQKGGQELVTLGEDSEVYTWDIRNTSNCIGKWKDEGGFGACMIETDVNGRYTSIASTTGIVNVYASTSLNPVPTDGTERKALRSIGNLTTAVTSMRYNHDSQLMAIASRVNKDNLKLVHLPSATVFANWPSQQTPLHHVTSVEFSKGSEYLAIGNARGKILLYTLNHFSHVGGGRQRR